MFKLKEYNDRTDFTQFDDLTPKQAIMAKCYDCCCYDRKEVKYCDVKDCPLYPFKKRWFNHEK